ncbi:MarR family transcriptional regulator [Allokutzneria sp. A3M-2-11 16]|uniref:MarR family winged helix-turn-helix transcriptional regulator n=1 Tax=Allokutzneria sp. A3M-2-11 16 TaxID=2962043 RepID=UPI0020B67C90|nr:MarR family winged helix-turn-helix transcriptional regulator [Allokutzneria sp. A3M-2-11 16]MCP3801959.1 MarR family transcriptional regulator [Allokutzneria sp. A3M-2-11 16]
MRDAHRCFTGLARLWRSGMRRVRPQLSGQHLDVLAAIAAAEGPVEVEELARRTHLTAQAVLRASSRLYAAGLIVCKPPLTEGSHLRCQLTGDGRRYLDRLADEQLHHLAVAVRRLPPAARKALGEFISELAPLLPRTP